MTGPVRARAPRYRRRGSTPPRVRVIGCGNVEAGDDAAGLLAVRALRRRIGRRRGVEIVEAPTGFHVLDQLADACSIVLVDAVHRPGVGRPGRAVRIEVGDEGLPAELSGSISTHRLGLAEAIGLGATLGRLPRTVFLGIEAADVRPGALLSPEVAYGLPALVDLIEAEVRRRLKEPEP